MIIKIIRAENLPASDVNGTSDPFVKVLYDGKEVACTPRVKRDLNPRWDAVVSFPLAPTTPLYVTLEVWDRDELSANDLLGALRLPFPDWRAHVDAFVKRQARERQRSHAQTRAQQIRDLHKVHSDDLSSASHSAVPGASAGMDAQRRSRSLNSSSVLQRAVTLDDADSTAAQQRLSTTSLASTAASETSASTQPLQCAPVLIWSRLIKGPLAQGRVLCAVQYEERDLRWFAHQPYGTRIQDVFLPQHPRFASEYCHLPRSWHPDFAVRQDELKALQAGTPNDCLFPWHETLLYMLEEVTVTFHVNESNQGVLATLVLTNYRVWFVPYTRVRGLVHEDVHTIPVGKILRATIAQQKRSNNNNVNVLVLENMDAGHYHVTLSPISRLRDAVRDFSRDAEAKRLKQLQTIVAEIEWLRLENSFCATTDLNHEVADADAARDEDDLRYYAPRPGGAARPPVLARALTEQFSAVNKTLATYTANGTSSTPSLRHLGSLPPPPPATAPKQLQLQLQLQHQHSAAPAYSIASPPSAKAAFAAKRRIQYAAEVEFRRQGVFSHPRWRACALNKKYEICATYPSYLVVPASLSDETITEASRFRSKNRFPALTWLHPRTGAPLCRSSQPNTGMLRSTNAHDRALIWAIRDAALPVESAWQSAAALPKKSSMLHIVDARPEINAKSNALTGKGHESVKQYDRDGATMASITFMGIDNIHVVRSSFVSLAQALYEVEDANFFGAVQKSRWLEHVCNVLQGACEVATHLERGEPVLVHCSDGWDRTAQLSALAQLMLDPYFRTLEGFAILIEKDWCAFGHMFEKRCGHPTSDQTSPIFPQFLDAVYQLTLQFPTHFQFNELFLSTIAEAVYASWHGTFQKNSEQARRAFLATIATVSVWDVIRASTDQYLNPLFIGTDGGPGSAGRIEPMLPVCRVRLMQLWVSQYQKAISHMRLQQREFEMLLLIRQQETELSRLYAVLSDAQQLELRAFQLRSDIASLARSMNLEYPPDIQPANGSANGSGSASSASSNNWSLVARSVSGPSTGTGGKRSPAASVDLHDFVHMVSSATEQLSAGATSASASTADPNNAPSTTANLPNARRRKSVTSRSRSNSFKLKHSIRSMMMGTMAGGTSNSSNSNSSSAHDANLTPTRTSDDSSTAAAGATATAMSTTESSLLPQSTSTASATSATASLSSPRQQLRHGASAGYSRQRSHDALRREVHRLEEQLASMNHQVALKEERAKVMLRHFRHYNYDLPESVTGFEYDSPSPTHKSRKTTSSKHHRRGNGGHARLRPSTSKTTERFHSPSAKSPSSSSNESSSSATSGPFNGASSGSDQSASATAAAAAALALAPTFTPGSSPLLTTTKVISSAGSFRNAQPVWERDGDAPCCKRCKKKFKTFYRPRHHCRCCGYVFCGKCTSNRMNLPEFGYYDVVRVCNVCYNSGEDG